MTTLLEKYNVAAPRYTSYPTVPHWDNTIPVQEQWKKMIRSDVGKEGISLYIHLPFCESLCTYCGCNTRITVNHGVESPYIGALLKEWSMYLSVFKVPPKIKEIHLGGGTPTFFRPENLEKLINGILSKSIICENAEFSFEAHPNNTSDNHLETLFKLGFRRLSLGIQDFDKKVQNIINRLQSYEAVEHVTHKARELGYTSVNYDLIYGLPLQTQESIVQTIEQVINLRPDRIAFYSCAHVPWVKPGQRKFTEADLPEGNEKRRLYETGRDLFENAGYSEIGMDHFALADDELKIAQNDKKLHRNFMGYTTSHTKLLIGLGVSSISDAWYGFVQNEKKVEDYYKRIEEGVFPFFKGHILSTKDLIIRKHILNIMCKGETSWDKEENHCVVIREGVERLEELKLDGLIELNANGLIVTPEGKPFLRNICMALDYKVWDNKSEEQIFSKVV